MQIADETNNNTDFFLWVKDNHLTMNHAEFARRLQNIQLNHPILPETAKELINEPQVKSTLDALQTLPFSHLQNNAPELFRVSLFAALCTLPLDATQLNTLHEAGANVSKITGATTPLTLAIYGNQPQVAQWLLQKGAPVTVTLSDVNTKANMALSKNLKDLSTGIGQLLNSATEFLDMVGPELLGQTQFQQLKSLQKQQHDQRTQQETPKPLDLAQTDQKFCEPHLHVCARQDRYECFSLLLEHIRSKMDLNVHGKQLFAALCSPQWQHSAVRYLECVHNIGVPIDFVTPEGHSPLHLAIIGLRLDNAQWLLDHGANAFNKLQDEELLKLLNCTDQELSTTQIAKNTFFSDTIDKKRQMVKLIRTRKKEIVGFCKLVQTDDPQALVTRLIALGQNHALINARFTRQGLTATPLAYAVKSNHAKNALLLLEYGANPHDLSQSLQSKLEKMKQQNITQASPTPTKHT